MSGAIIRTRADYYRHLIGVTSTGGWEPWVLYILRAVEDTARWTMAKIRGMRELLGTTSTLVRAKAPKIYSRELVEVIFEQPYCRISNVVTAGIAKRQTASVYLARLVDIGVLTVMQFQREKLFIHRALLDLLAAEVATGRGPATPTFAASRAR